MSLILLIKLTSLNFNSCNWFYSKEKHSRIENGRIDWKRKVIDFFRVIVVLVGSSQDNSSLYPPLTYFNVKVTTVYSATVILTWVALHLLLLLLLLFHGPIKHHIFLILISSSLHLTLFFDNTVLTKKEEVHKIVDKLVSNL